MGRLAEVTEDQMIIAWQDCKRPHWPPTFEECMKDELKSRLIRMHAAYGLQAQARLAQKTRDARAQRRAQTTLQSLDFKSLAAGEKLDKDD